MSRHFKVSRVTTCSLLILLVMLNCALLRANAESTTVFLDPPNQTISAIGDSFTVNVSIAGVNNLYGYEFQLFYSSAVMNGTPPAIEGPFLKSGGSTYFSTTNFTDNYNATFGIVWIDCLLTGQVPGVDGGGVLVTIKFKSLALGNTVSMYLADVKLSDPNANPIPCQISDGTVTIVPEFTSLFAMSALITVSLFVVLVVKRKKSNTPYPNH